MNKGSDKEILNIIREWKEEAGVTGMILLSPNPESSSLISIYTDEPNAMFHLLKKYEERLYGINSHLTSISFIETGNFYM